jgi:hypothetical protein
MPRRSNTFSREKHSLRVTCGWAAKVVQHTKAKIRPMIGSKRAGMQAVPGLARGPIRVDRKGMEEAMSANITTTFVALVFLLAAVGVRTGATTSNAQDRIVEEDTRKNPDFDPTQFPGEDLGPLLKGKKFSNGKHTLKAFADGTKLVIETKNGKIKRAFLIEANGSKSDATIHSPVGSPTARRFTVGVHLGGGNLEVCFICTFGKDNKQQSAGAETRRRKLCYRAPCDDFVPEPDPPTIDPLKKSTGSKKPKP